MIVNVLNVKIKHHNGNFRRRQLFFCRGILTTESFRLISDFVSLQTTDQWVQNAVGREGLFGIIADRRGKAFKADLLIFETVFSEATAGRL